MADHQPIPVVKLPPISLNSSETDTNRRSSIQRRWATTLLLMRVVKSFEQLTVDDRHVLVFTTYCIIDPVFSFPVGIFNLFLHSK